MYYGKEEKFQQRNKVGYVRIVCVYDKLIIGYCDVCVAAQL